MGNIEQLVMNLKSSTPIPREPQAQRVELQEKRDALSLAQTDEMLKKFRYLHENTNNKLDTFRYELDLIKDDNARQRRSHSEYRDKVEFLTN